MIHPSSKCSEATFRRVFKQQWKGVLLFEARSEHSKCTICGECKHILRTSEDAHERALTETRYQDHIKGVIADRQYDERMDTYCEQHLGQNIYSPLLKIDLDGMDQAKVKCPKLPNIKKFEGCWRPMLHLIGVRVIGLPLVTIDTNQALPYG